MFVSLFSHYRTVTTAKKSRLFARLIFLHFLMRRSTWLYHFLQELKANASFALVFTQRYMIEHIEVTEIRRECVALNIRRPFPFGGIPMASPSNQRRKCMSFITTALKTERSDGVLLPRGGDMPSSTLDAFVDRVRRTYRRISIANVRVDYVCCIDHPLSLLSRQSINISFAHRHLTSTMIRPRVQPMRIVLPNLISSAFSLTK